jgi:hypothetical protein
MTKPIKAVAHATTITALKSILGIGYVLDQNSRTKYMVRSLDKIILPRDVTMSKIKYNKDYEASGVYFRIITKYGKPNINPFKPILLVFSPDILLQYQIWTLNSIENNGFVFGTHNQVSKSNITGKNGTTYYMSIEEEDLKKLDPSKAELVIPANINLCNLKHIEIPTSFLDSIELENEHKNMIVQS